MRRVVIRLPYKESDVGSSPTPGTNYDIQKLAVKNILLSFVSNGVCFVTNPLPADNQQNRNTSDITNDKFTSNSRQ